MAAKKKGLHASKQRSNSSPELQLQVTDIDSADRRHGTTVKTTDWSKYGDDDSKALHCKFTTNKSDGINNSSEATESANASRATKSTVVPVQDEAKPCKSCGKTSEIEPNLGPSVRPKVRNYRFKTRTRHVKSLAVNKQQQGSDANRIIMDIGDNSGTVNSSSSEAEGTGEPSSKQQKRQGIGRVATAFVARFRHKGRKHQRRSSNTDSDSSSSIKDVKLDSPRPRSKSFSGRIMRKLGTKDKSVNGKDSPCRDFNTRRKGWPHANRIQSCIGVVFTGKGTLKHKGKSSKTEQDTRQPRRYTPVINLEEFNPDDYPIESEDDIQRVLREQEIREGVDPPPGYQPFDHFLAKVETHPEAETKATASLKNSLKDCKEEEKPGPSAAAAEALLNASTSAGYPVLAGSTHTTANIYDQYGSLTPEGTYIPRTVHTQIDYMHCLVPDQKSIMDSSFYWGKIDRFEADLLLENKPEGTFLLRDSAHDEFVFSVSFRRYGRTLHARIEQWKHKFSFDAHDPGVYASDTICGLLKHYKDPNFCMFFEPMLTTPLPRPNPPSLQELARATICSHTSYDGITHLALPRTLKEYSREYHYKQRVRMRRFEVPEMPVVVEPKIGVITKTCISR